MWSGTKLTANTTNTMMMSLMDFWRETAPCWMEDNPRLGRHKLLLDIIFVYVFLFRFLGCKASFRSPTWIRSTAASVHSTNQNFTRRSSTPCHPIKALTLVKSRQAHLVCCLVWCAVTVCLVPNLIFVTTSRRDNDTLCHDTTSQKAFNEYVDYSSVVMVLLFGIPFIVILVCYCLMARALCRPRRGLSSIQQGASSRRKSIKLIIVVLVVFAVSFVPFHITRTLYYTARVLDLNCEFLNVVNFTYKITRPLASVNSCIDPILYFLAGDHYRTKMMSVLTGRREMKSSSTPEHVQTQPNNNCNIGLVCKNS
ncbi:P2Y purinoceptor 4 [Nematolebias whitei]|uniref:P2Y purinoceptor 4 n=1 Tax=Nematolebias whitei TaxID=451745 RepID=UPI001898A765|nr:P2Y purinoceptor 4 [Nematolebias whitei]